MNKINVLLGALVLSSTSVLTSCFSNDIPEIVIQPGNQQHQTADGVSLDSSAVVTTAVYNFTITSNVPVDLVINGEAAGIGRTQYSNRKPKDTELEIVATCNDPEYSPETIVKKVTLDTNGKVIDFRFVKAPNKATVGAKYPYAVTLGDALSMIQNENDKYGDTLYVENTLQNRPQPYGNNAPSVAKMAIYKDMITNALANGKTSESLFSITLREATDMGIEQNLNDVNESFPVMIADCEPDGANFGSKPAKVHISNKYYQRGMSFDCYDLDKDPGKSNKINVNVDEKGGGISVAFDHFSDKTIFANVVVQRRGEDVVTTNSMWDVKVGNLKYNYFVYGGYDCDMKDNAFITKYLDAKFGKKSFSASGEATVKNESQRASVPYTVTQKVYLFDVYFGSVKVGVRVYGEASLKVDLKGAVVYDTTKHSGGSGY